MHGLLPQCCSLQQDSTARGSPIAQFASNLVPDKAKML